MKKLLIGAHTSAAGGVHNALNEGADIGATTIQLFTSNQKRWSSAPISEEEIARWKESLKTSGISHVMSHDSYLINLGSCDDEIIVKSRAAFAKELSRCHQLDITYLNFHPGAYTSGDVQSCLDIIVASIMEVASLAQNGSTRLLLETTAGQGSSVGSSFEHLSYIIKKTHAHVPIGVCIDTCHIFAAGYDIRGRKDVETMLDTFDSIIGLEHLYAFHLNDSMKPFGSKKDRHANLGEGEIGWECFETLMQHPKTKYIPKYLETPGGIKRWKQEIQQLRAFAA